ncbi:MULTISPECIES: fimbrial protein [Pseudomonas]|uniref:Fimbrial protein n=1 Tax=Pseudomonas gessardii TaxID=78544 RepID=A0ABS9FBL2_9PSED|nr:MULTISPECIES: fimbrial protein [Pseudomonas]MBH3423986.1 fimbrial protein [Pseudomonas gessardii]MCF4982133.1 fimbrial protein [Pseudomonas gessardii]MCF4993724.1 fimbrial protein [Pseudomonas gessardii]MCF5088156.1 fimbrial protein [Pseudomonas gessardii]MCF5098959.1 fimbrial protein [Pseudomonas gessardii]
MNVLYQVLLGLSVATLSLACIADNMQLSGTLLVRPVCAVSDKGRRIDVSFGNLAVSRIDGERYLKAIPYQISCPGAVIAAPWRMLLTLKGIPTVFEPKAVQSSVPDLGIKIMLGGTELIPNLPRYIQIIPTTLPLLEAVPVKLAGSDLPSIDFNASALLLAEFY